MTGKRALTEKQRRIKLNPTRKSAKAREVMNQLSLLERRCFLETVSVTMKQLQDNVISVKIQAINLEQSGRHVFSDHGTFLCS